MLLLRAHFRGGVRGTVKVGALSSTTAIAVSKVGANGRLFACCVCRAVSVQRFSRFLVCGAVKGSLDCDSSGMRAHGKSSGCGQLLWAWCGPGGRRVFRCGASRWARASRGILALLVGGWESGVGS